jgi:hypothetical protein
MPKKHPTEVCERAVRMTLDRLKNYPSMWTACRNLAPTSTLAIVALIVSFFAPIVRLILGYVARKEVDNSGGRLSGRGLATAAIVINWLWVGSLIIWGFAAAALLAQISSY